MQIHKRVLLVSPYSYSLSSRGMDVLTNCFEEEGWDVTHLTFPRTFYTPKITFPENSMVKAIQGKTSLIPYIDRVMFWFPRFLFNFIKMINNNSVKDIDFTRFDYIVLESGKPLFLMDIIPKNIPIIYRLSDSVQLVLGKNKYYHKLEKDVFKRSEKMIFKKEVYKNQLTPEQQEKTTVIENGMVIPSCLDPSKKFKENTKNAVYVGLHPLDFPTVKLLLSEISNCNFHIIGPCLNKKQVEKLDKYTNFTYYPFLSNSEYLPMLRDASVAIFPFKRTESMKWFGLTSKILHFMYFSLPVILYPTGIEGEFNNLDVDFAKNKEEFVQLVKSRLQSGDKIDYKLDFEFYSASERKKEYKNFIGTL